MHKSLGDGGQKRKYLYIFIAIILLIGAVLILYRSLSASVQVTSPSVSIPNLNASDVAVMIPNASYATSLAGNITMFESALKSEGYIGSSISTFNLSKGYNRSDFPNIISSSVFLMSNQSSAESALSGILLSSSGQVGGNESYAVTDYLIGNTSIAIYAKSTVAIFNASAINSTTSRLLNLPIYQYASVFAYKNYTSTIVLNSFSPNQAFLSDSIYLSEDLAGKMMQSP